MTDQPSITDKLKGVKIPYQLIDHSDNEFTDEERRYLVGQLKSMFAFVGCVVPDTMNVDGATVPLREILWRLLTKETLSDNELDLAKELIPILDKQVRENRKMLEDYNLSDEEAEKLYFQACGMLKALVTLRELEKNRKKGLEEATNDEKINDAKRLIELIKRVM